MRTVGAVAPASPTGLTVTLGSPVEAGDWIVPVASSPSISSTTVVVTNPSSTESVTVSVSTVGAGVASPLAGADQVQILPGGRGGFEIPTGAGKPEVAVEITSSQPVVVESRIVFTAGGLTEPLAVPVVTSAVVATTGIPAVPPGEVVPAPNGGDTSVPGDAPATTTTAPASTTPPAGANPGG